MADNSAFVADCLVHAVRAAEVESQEYQIPRPQNLECEMSTKYNSDK